MIIFDLDGCLADCSHRRHFVDPKVNENCVKLFHYNEGDMTFKYYDRRTKEKFKPDYKAFNELCDKDQPIWPTIRLFQLIQENLTTQNIQIWSGRCESVRGKTEYWLNEYVCPMKWGDKRLKMRPIGDSTPDEQLKERWLDDHLSTGGKVDFVVDDRPKVLRMYQRRGIFTFDVGQGKGEF